MKIKCRYREHGDDKVSLDQDDVVATLRRYADIYSDSPIKDVLNELADGFASVRKLIPLEEALREVV